MVALEGFINIDFLGSIFLDFAKEVKIEMKYEFERTHSGFNVQFFDKIIQKQENSIEFW